MRVVRAAAIAVVLAAIGGPALAQDCARADQLCADAEKSYQDCVLQNPILGGAVCSPLFDAKLSICAQANFTCRRPQGQSETASVLRSDAHRAARADAQRRAAELLERAARE